MSGPPPGPPNVPGNPSLPPQDPPPQRRFQPYQKRQPTRMASGPRKVRTGIKLRSKDLSAITIPIALRWLKLLEQAIEQEQRQIGLEYARMGQVVSIAFETAAVRGNVQGAAHKPHQVRVLFPSLQQDQWERLIEAMAQEAIYLAKLLSHEIPAGIEDVLMREGGGAALLPASVDSLQFECSCGQAKCRHLAALGYIAAEAINDDPLVVFTLLGMPAERLLDRLRQARAINTQGMASAHVDALIPESQFAPLPLEACIDEFWRMGPRIKELERAPSLHHVPHALLRRLGPPPLGGRFPMVGLLASVYDTVAAYARKLSDE